MNPDPNETRIVLTDEEWEKFNEALADPAERNEALRKFLTCPAGWDVPPEDDMEWLPSTTADKPLTQE